MRDTIKHKIKGTIGMLVLLPLLTVLQPGFAASFLRTDLPTQNEPANDAKVKSKVVYVCACLKNKSCSCMTEARPRAHAPAGPKGPPMKEVPKNSAWAKANRDALGN
jgi:hypothetical protein